MTVLEAIVILASLGLLITQNTRRANRKASFAFFALGAAALVTSVLFGQARWQMGFAYLLFAILSLLLWRRAYSHFVVRFFGVTIALLMLAVSGVLSAGMPLVSLPEPDGPNAVGSTSLTLTDESRDESIFGAPDDKRELYVQIWYPGDVDEDAQPLRARTLWEELYTGEGDLVSFLAGYMSNMRTHSFENIPLSSASASFPLIVFTHGMLSIAEQNTLLMEHLASHGFVVIAVGHTYMSTRVNLSRGRSVSLDFERYNAILSERTGPTSDVILEQAARMNDPEQRVSLWLEYFENSTGLNSLMAIWIEDLQFVLDTVLTQASDESELARFGNRIDGTRIGVAGMSFGGGAVAEFCKADSRCRAGLNLDGFANYGARQRQPLQVPYLALVNPANELSEIVLQDSETYYALTVEGAAHGSFTDLALTLPLVKWLGLSRIPGERMIELMNAVSLSFFDAYLRDGPAPDFNESTYPELAVTVN